MGTVSTVSDQRGGLEEPPVTLADFPVHALSTSDPLHRCAREEREPWWFGSSGDGRFDLVSPLGTCYLADDPLTALLEVLASESPAVPRVVPAAFLRRRLVWRLAVPRLQRVADATQRRAAGFGASELGTAVDYPLTQRWARALYGAGFRGVRARSRQDPGPGRNLALFGKAGARRSWRQGVSTPALDFAARLLSECGVAVEEAPSFGELQKA